jgi:hypothetical protein
MKNFKSKILKSNGEQVEVAPKGKHFSLAEMQEIVGGNIEMVFLKNNMIMVVNEEGKLFNLPMNFMATLLMKEFSNDFVVGDVLITSRTLVN